MQTNHSTHRINSGEPVAAQRQHGVSGGYVTPSPLEDVLHEQLNYLISHATRECLPGCAICDRLSRVLGPLLEPFRPRG